MKFKIYIVLIYLFALFALPSVRTIKVLFHGSCEMSCSKSQEMACDTAKFVMSLNFSPVQFVKELNIILLFDFSLELEEKNISLYENLFISKYLNSIWHPPKIY